MRKSTLLLIALCVVAACAKHDPILPGTRTAIFDAATPVVLNQDISDLPDAALEITAAQCPYSQDSSNVIWYGDKKIFSGFPTSNSVKSNARPVCDGGYVYAGLTTGELVKINPKNRQIMWIADIYRDSNITGGATTLDIVAPIVVAGGAVYVGGLGDAFCKINAATGAKKWCTSVGTAHPFVIAGDAIFVAGADKALYALRESDGAIYWRTEIKSADAPSYAKKVIRVAGTKYNATDGKKLRR